MGWERGGNSPPTEMGPRGSEQPHRMGLIWREEQELVKSSGPDQMDPQVSANSWTSVSLLRGWKGEGALQ